MTFLTRKSPTAARRRPDPASIGGGLATLVAVTPLYTVGFEGYDRRFMVIPLGPSLGANP
jgi:hypothetical protein